ncbi:hypothetical protein HFP51_12720 [Parasphingopyxis sp. CP4]|uniref:hypothetical protein n=1 Tax=Parasphingopyxis sp. CP4 TaxID=2724527 RepID=UPI0015A0D5F9|nr:hypothetical protein [Parasphingopyxis sp. CP4]QLC22972.1 hypothetical protein HFP51_12720 [Parasphingopyxis sp. CP4]
MNRFTMATISLCALLPGEVGAQANADEDLVCIVALMALQDREVGLPSQIHFQTRAEMRGVAIDASEIDAALLAYNADSENVTEQCLTRMQQHLERGSVLRDLTSQRLSTLIERQHPDSK